LKIGSCSTNATLWSTGRLIKSELKIWCEIGHHQHIGKFCDLRGGMCKNCWFVCENANQLICNDFFSSEFSSSTWKIRFFSYTKQWFFFSNNFLTSRKKKPLLEYMNELCNHTSNELRFNLSLLFFITSFQRQMFSQSITWNVIFLSPNQLTFVIFKKYQWCPWKGQTCVTIYWSL